MIKFNNLDKAIAFFNLSHNLHSFGVKSFKGSLITGIALKALSYKVATVAGISVSSLGTACFVVAGAALLIGVIGYAATKSKVYLVTPKLDATAQSTTILFNGTRKLVLQNIFGSDAKAPKQPLVLKNG